MRARSDLRWDIALRDLDVALTLDTDGNRDLTWGETAPRGRASMRWRWPRWWWRAAALPSPVTRWSSATTVPMPYCHFWVKLSPSFVEPAIAATIMLAAFDNLRPLLLRWRGWVTFCFGLIHGFGFAGVLGELQLPPAQFGWALFQFNLGLELGQLCLVLTVVPLLFALRLRTRYVALVLRGGSAAALLMAVVWLVERTSDWRLLPG